MNPHPRRSHGGPDAHVPVLASQLAVPAIAADLPDASLMPDAQSAPSAGITRPMGTSTRSFSKLYRAAAGPLHPSLDREGS
jgi:hypothetical protein